MEINRRVGGGVTVLELTGPFVVSPGETEVLPLRSAIRHLVAEGRPTVALNLAGLTAIDARGLGELVLAFTTVRSHGGALALVAPPPTVTRLLAVTKLDGILPVCASAADVAAAARAVQDGTERRRGRTREVEALRY